MAGQPGAGSRWYVSRGLPWIGWRLAGPPEPVWLPLLRGLPRGRWPFLPPMPRRRSDGDELIQRPRGAAAVAGADELEHQAVEDCDAQGRHWATSNGFGHRLQADRV